MEILAILFVAVMLTPYTMFIFIAKDIFKKDIEYERTLSRYLFKRFDNYD